MILDAVEYHEAALPDDFGWESAAALLACLILWAKEREQFAPAGAEALRPSQIEEIGDPITPPSEWISSEADFVISDAIFAPAAAEFLREFVGTGRFYGIVSEYLRSDRPYGLPDDWSGLKPIAELIQRAFVEWIAR